MKPEKRQDILQYFCTKNDPIVALFKYWLY